jgi:hypothetical protein
MASSIVQVNTLVHGATSALQRTGVKMSDTPHSGAEAKGPMPFEQRYSATIDDSVEGTGASRSRIYELIKAGKVQTAQNGRRPLVIVSSLINALKK